MIITGALLIFGIKPTYPLENSNIKIGGSYLGISNFIKQENKFNTLSKRNQFDFAANLDLEWNIHPRIIGVLQLQMGSGEGSLGFAGSSAVLTDINLEVCSLNIFNSIL